MGGGSPAGRFNPVPGAAGKVVRTHPGRSRAGRPRLRRVASVSSAPGAARPAINWISDAPTCKTSSAPNIVVARIRIRAKIVALVAPSRILPTVTGLHATRVDGGRGVPHRPSRRASSRAGNRHRGIDRLNPVGIRMARTGSVEDRVRTRWNGPAGRYVALDETMKRRIG